MRYSLIWVGINPPGTTLNITPAAQSSSRYTANTAPRRPKRFAYQSLIAVRAAQEKAVKRTENPAKQAIDQPVGRSSSRRVGFNSRLRQRGESVSELMAEIIVGRRWSPANCLCRTGRNWRKTPSGANTAQHQRNSDNGRRSLLWRSRTTDVPRQRQSPSSILRSDVLRRRH